MTGLTAAQATTEALFARDRGAGGQHVSPPLINAALSFLWPDGHEHATFVGEGAELFQPVTKVLRPVKTADGYVTIMPVTDDQMTCFMIAVDRAELLADPRFVTREARNANLAEWRKEVAANREEFATEELLARLTEADVPCAPVLRPEEVVEYEPVAASGSVVELEDPVAGRIRQPRPPARFNKTPEAIRSHAPALGEHSGLR
ncbi:MAG: CoA transferase [Phycisphaerales bacterium JB058]